MRPGGYWIAWRAKIFNLCKRATIQGFVCRCEEKCGSLAQLVEQRTFNPLVAGSNPARPTRMQPESPSLSWVTGIFLGAPGGLLVGVAVSTRGPRD